MSRVRRLQELRDKARALHRSTFGRLVLLNCRACDDIIRLLEQRRRCACGASSGQLDAAGEPRIEGRHAELMELDWEDYDAGRGGRWSCSGGPVRAAGRGG
jgi:hypothetical protein